jgi:hypothetical protein
LVSLTRQLLNDSEFDALAPGWEKLNPCMPLFSDSLHCSLQPMKVGGTIQWTQPKKSQLGLQELANLSLKNAQVHGMNRFTLWDPDA